MNIFLAQPAAWAVGEFVGKGAPSPLVPAHALGWRLPMKTSQFRPKGTPGGGMVPLIHGRHVGAGGGGRTLTSLAALSDFHTASAFAAPRLGHCRFRFAITLP